MNNYRDHFLILDEVTNSWTKRSQDTGAFSTRIAGAEPYQKWRDQRHNNIKAKEQKFGRPKFNSQDYKRERSINNTTSSMYMRKERQRTQDFKNTVNRIKAAGTHDSYNAIKSHYGNKSHNPLITRGTKTYSIKPKSFRKSLDHKSNIW